MTHNMFFKVVRCFVSILFLVNLFACGSSNDENPTGNDQQQYDDIDLDFDGDGYLDTDDAFPQDFCEYADSDSDSVGDFEDADDDNDGIEDVNDAFPLDPSEFSDVDADGVGDNADFIDSNRSSRSWWVVSGAEDGGDGSRNSPWNSLMDIDKNRSSIFSDQSDDRIIYVSGLFMREALIFSGENFGEANRVIQVRGDGPGMPSGIIDGGSDPDLRFLVSLTQDNYIHIYNLEVRNSSSLNNADCVKVSFATGVLLRNVLVHDCGFNGIVARDVRDYSVLNSVVHSSAKGIVVGSNDLGVVPINSNIVLKGNESFDNYLYGIQVGGDENAGDIRFDVFATVSFNHLHNNGSGLQVENAGHIVIKDNSIYNNNFVDPYEPPPNQYNSGIVIQSVHDVQIISNNINNHFNSSILSSRHGKAEYPIDNYRIEIAQNTFNNASYSHISRINPQTSGFEGEYSIVANKFLHTDIVSSDIVPWKVDVASLFAHNTGFGGDNVLLSVGMDTVKNWSFVNNIWSNYNVIAQVLDGEQLNFLSNCYFSPGNEVIFNISGKHLRTSEVKTVDVNAIITDPMLDSQLNTASIYSPVIDAGVEINRDREMYDFHGQLFSKIHPTIGMMSRRSIPAHSRTCLDRLRD